MSKLRCWCDGWCGCYWCFQPLGALDGVFAEHTGTILMTGRVFWPVRYCLQRKQVLAFSKTWLVMEKEDACKLINIICDLITWHIGSQNRRIGEFHRISWARTALLDCAAAAKAEYGRLINKNKAKWVNKLWLNTYVRASALLVARIISRLVLWSLKSLGGGNLMRLQIKLTGEVKDFREAAGEADVVLLRTSYANYKDNLTSRNTDARTQDFQAPPYDAVHAPSRG